MNNADGDCVAIQGTCNDECGSSGGTRKFSFCQCKKLTLTEDVCNKNCRTLVKKTRFTAAGDLIVTDKTAATRTVVMNTHASIAGSVKCLQSDQNRCSVTGIGISSGNDFTSNYDLSTSTMTTLATDLAGLVNLRRNLA